MMIHLLWLNCLIQEVVSYRESGQYSASCYSFSWWH